jgi:hypothetical protein
MWISLLLSLWLLSILQEHADSMYVCMAVSLIGWGHVSLHGCSEGASSGGGDPPGPFRGQGGQFSGTRKQWRQPTAGTTYDQTYHIVSFIPIFLRTYMIISDVWQFGGGDAFFPSHTHTYKYVCRLLHICTCIQCMYVQNVCMYECTYYVYTVCT